MDKEEEEEEVKVGGTTNGKYRFNGKHIYVTWSKSTIDSKEEFEEKLLAILPAGTSYFGGRELHEDGSPHYHVVFSFEDKQHFRDARARFSIEGDTNAIRIEKPKARQDYKNILENTQAYCGKDGDTIGKRNN